MADESAAVGWQPFDYNDPPEGLCWLEIERPETWCDADYDGRSIGGYTGKTRRLVVLAGVYLGENGPEFDSIGGGQHGEVEDDDTVRRFLVLTPPPLASEFDAETAENRGELQHLFGDGA